MLGVFCDSDKCMESLTTFTARCPGLQTLRMGCTFVPPRTIRLLMETAVATCLSLEEFGFYSDGAYHNVESSVGLLREVLQNVPQERKMKRVVSLNWETDDVRKDYNILGKTQTFKGKLMNVLSKVKS